MFLYISMCLYLHMHVYLHYIHLHLYTCNYICLCFFICTRIYICICVYISIHASLLVCLSMWTHICIYLYMHLCICVCILYIHLYLYAYLMGTTHLCPMWGPGWGRAHLCSMQVPDQGSWWSLGWNLVGLGKVYLYFILPQTGHCFRDECFKKRLACIIGSLNAAAFPRGSFQPYLWACLEPP